MARRFRSGSCRRLPHERHRRCGRRHGVHGAFERGDRRHADGEQAQVPEPEQPEYQLPAEDAGRRPLRQQRPLRRARAGNRAHHQRGGRAERRRHGAGGRGRRDRRVPSGAHLRLGPRRRPRRQRRRPARARAAEDRRTGVPRRRLRRHAQPCRHGQRARDGGQAARGRGRRCRRSGGGHPHHRSGLRRQARHPEAVVLQGRPVGAEPRLRQRRLHRGREQGHLQDRDRGRRRRRRGGPGGRHRGRPGLCRWADHHHPERHLSGRRGRLPADRPRRVRNRDRRWRRHHPAADQGGRRLPVRPPAGPLRRGPRARRGSRGARSRERHRGHRRRGEHA